MSTTAALRRGIGAVCVSALVITCAAGVAQADPAPADPGPVISTVDTSTPGHATGTVSTDRPYVLVQLGTTSIESDAEPVVDGTASFDLPTWGFDSTTIRAVGCTSTDPASCDTETTESPVFTATDVAPTVTWPSDRSIQGEQVDKITVSDPDGGGVLRVAWVPDDPDARTAEQDVSRNGVTNLGLIDTLDSDMDGVGDNAQVDDGTGTLVLERCAAPLGATESDCHALSVPDGNGGQVPLSVRMEIDHSFYAIGHVDAPVCCDGNGYRPVVAANAATVPLAVTFSDLGTYQVAWRIVNASSESTIWRSGTQTVELTSSRSTTLNLPTESLPGTTLTVIADVRRASSVGNSFWTQVNEKPYGSYPRFDADDAGPAVSDPLFSTPDLFPARDGFRDSTGISVNAQNEPWYDVSLSISNDVTHQVVHTQSAGDFLHPQLGPSAPPGGDGVTFTPWDGTDTGGALVAPGWYTATVTAHDAFGNPRRSSAQLHVDGAVLARHTWTGTVSATGSRVASAAGRCSRIVVPASRRWTGSLMLGSGVVPKCKPRTSADRSVHTTHQLTMPALPMVDMVKQPLLVVANPGHYDALTVSAYGGGALKSPRGLAAIRWVSAANRLETGRTMSSGLGNHASYARVAAGLVRPDRTVRWDAYTSGVNSYDLKAFTVTLSYTALTEPPAA